jgi:hypothetical protein
VKYDFLHTIFYILYIIYYMGFTELTQSLIKDIDELNKFIKDNKLETDVDINKILEKVITQEREYALLKHNLENSELNLEKNIALLKKKCDIEYKVYETLIEHKEKLNELKKKKNQNELPPIDAFTKKLFNVDKFLENEKNNDNKSKKNNISTKNNDQNKLSGGILQEQLNAAIVARRSAIGSED